LIVTMGFVVAFTLLGMASLHFAMMQNEATERQKASMEAFWLADGALEQARARFPNLVEKEQLAMHLTNDQDEPLDNKYFDFHSRRKVEPNGYQRQFRYEVLSYGTVNGQKRYILAELDKYNIPDYPFVTTFESINSPVPPKMIDKLEIFVEEACDENLYVDNIPAGGFRGATCVYVENVQNITVPEKNPDQVANVLFIDVTQVNQLEGGTFVPTITFDGPVDGIVQIRGDVRLNLANLNNVNLQINGALLVDGRVEFVDNNTLAQDPELVFNAELVDKALLLIPSYEYFNSYNLDAKIIKWEEVAELGEEI
ncbi:MAG: hypothetical protein K8I00_03050, partial [Candidatus Omnitrophica bacterium]|nr:hypothetical protein [Candidatus Omnitrophota bacterium]